jgi:hypothetical protein
MTQSISFDAATTTRRSQGNHPVRRLVLWTSILVVTSAIGMLLALDASITPGQRIEMFQQSGVFP